VAELQEFAKATSLDPTLWPKPENFEVLNTPLETTEDYAALISTVNNIWSDLFVKAFSVIYSLFGKDLAQTVPVFASQFFLILFPRNELPKYQEVTTELARLLLEGISADKSHGKQVLKDWVNGVVPGYFFGQVPQTPDENQVILDERADPSNTSSKERLELLKQWISEVGAENFFFKTVRKIK
jgi:uncharacterized protein YozE (UPF0346 family)